VDGYGLGEDPKKGLQKHSKNSPSKGELKGGGIFIKGLISNHVLLGYITFQFDSDGSPREKGEGLTVKGEAFILRDFLSD